MKPEEISVDKFLRNRYGENVLFEPDGNVPPDFVVNSTCAVEVRRLNQQFFSEEKIEGLEQLSFPLYHVLKEVLASFDSQYNGKSYWVFVDYKRPLDKNIREIKSDLQNSLKTIIQTDLSLPYMLQVNKKIKLWLYSSDPVKGQVFRFGGEDDGDAGGWVVPVYIENIRHCITEKSSKIKQYKLRYKEWWLYLVDFMELGLDQEVVKEMKSAISDLGEFNKVAVVNYMGEFLRLDLPSK